MTELITDPIEFLEGLLEGHPWEEFEGIYNGTLEIDNIWFKLRVGQHMKRTFQTIISSGKFVRMRSAPKFELATKTLTPDDPDTCLYFVMSKSTDHIGTMCWTPYGFTADSKSVPQPSVILQPHMRSPS